MALALLLAFLGAAAAFGFQNEELEPSAIERISPQEARSDVQAGKAFLVCAYSGTQCEGKMLEGALTRKEFEEKLPSLPKDREIITYCS